MEFTFYGDLIGIGSAYWLSPNTAYEKLNDFYNETLVTLDVFSDNPQNHVEMYSDSLLIIGEDALSALPYIGLLYANLIGKGLLLRGAIVSGKLTYDARITKHNFIKRIPEHDTLARAAAMEKIQKGARFLIEPALANELLSDYPDWLTHDGYIRSIRLDGDPCLRRICPTPDGYCYEYLYYWREGIAFRDYDLKVKDIKAIMVMHDKKVRKHYEETIAVIERAKQRHKATSERLEP